jgi:hypothetical protein
MAQMGLDKWLKGLYDLTSLDPANLEQRLAGLQSEADAIQLKIAVLTQLLTRARQNQHEAQQEAEQMHATTTPQPSGGPVGGSVPSPPNGAGSAHRPPTWKRDAVLAVMREDPSREWSAEEIKRILNERGIMQGEEGTTTRVLLRRMAEREEVIKVGRATYSVHRPTLIQTTPAHVQTTPAYIQM